MSVDNNNTNTGRCISCAHWKRHKLFDKFGRCALPVTTGDCDAPPFDRILLDDNCDGAEAFTGEQFGCVHWLTLQDHYQAQEMAYRALKQALQNGREPK